MATRTKQKGRAQSLITALTVAGMAVVAIASTTAAGGTFGPDKVVRTIPAGEIDISDIAAVRDDIAITWRETAGGYTSHLKYSTDGGKTFSSRIDLGAADLTSGAPVEICAGFVLTLAGGQEDQLALRSLDGEIEHGRTLLDDPISTHGMDLTCVGDRRFAAGWYDLDTGRPMIAVQPLFEPLKSYVFDLGPGALPNPNLAAADDTLYAAWLNNGNIRLKRFSVQSGSAARVTPLATETVVDSGTVFDVRIAASGERVVLAYIDGNDLLLRMSTNNGQSFGPVRTVIDEPDGGSTIAGPNSVDVRGSTVLVEATEYDPSVGYQLYGLVSENAGKDWSVTPSHESGVQIGVLFQAHDQLSIAEAWDERYNSPPGSLGTEKLRFHTGTP